MSFLSLLVFISDSLLLFCFLRLLLRLRNSPRIIHTLQKYWHNYVVVCFSQVVASTTKLFTQIHTLQKYYILISYAIPSSRYIVHHSSPHEYRYLHESFVLLLIYVPRESRVGSVGRLKKLRLIRCSTLASKRHAPGHWALVAECGHNSRL